jgi:uncharacterized membrane protein YdbT with pleckstrin-like domain
MPSPKTKLKTVQKYVIRRSLWILLGRIFRLEIFLVVVFAVVEMFILINNVPGEIYMEEVLFFIILQIFNVIVLGWSLLDWYAEKYIIISDKIIVKRGILNPKENIHLFKNIESIHMKRSLLGIIFGYGTILIYLPILQQTATIQKVSHPQKYIRILERYMAYNKKNKTTGNILIQS